LAAIHIGQAFDYDVIENNARRVGDIPKEEVLDMIDKAKKGDYKLVIEALNKKGIETQGNAYWD
jgi:hypothetical protein